MLFGIISIAPLKNRSRVYDLKARLDWGKPALTIIDIRERSEFLFSHISGAINMPLPELVDRVRAALEPSRDIYLYSDADEDTAAAAELLRQSGFLNVSELQGGLPAWKAMEFPIEQGVVTVV
jgi:rhodanese-related sulfurtransferase